MFGENEIVNYEDYSEVIIEERTTLLTQTSAMAPSEYLYPEIMKDASSEK